MTEFKIGDRVRYLEKGGIPAFGNQEGVVIEPSEGPLSYDWVRVSFDNGELYFCMNKNLELIPNFEGRGPKLPLSDGAPLPRAELLRRAETLITGDRNKSYGSPTENFKNTAALWNVQLGHKFKDGEAFTASDVALLMVQLKLARMIASPGKQDNADDAAGYMACYWECIVEEEKEND